jgi:hypothetical protein
MSEETHTLKYVRKPRSDKAVSEEQRRQRRSDSNNEYRKRHMDKYRQYGNSHYHKNREKILARQKELRLKKKEELEKKFWS